MKLRDVLVPKPFVGVVLWASAAGVVMLAVATHESGASRPAEPSLVARDAGASTAKPDVAATHPEESAGWSRDASEYQVDWPDRTHEVVAWMNEFLMADEPGTLRVGEQSDPKNPDVHISVTKEVFGPDHDLRIRVERGDGYAYSIVALETARREKRITARAWSEDDTLPNPPPEWLEVGGQAWINTWIWPEHTPLVIDYRLYGVHGGIRQGLRDRVVIDF